MKKRTEINWDKHVLKISEVEKGIIYEFEKPDTYCDSIKFINICGILAITGDYGNWILCREFHPSKDGFVSDGYWLEKLRIASTQDPCVWDEELIRKEIEEQLKEEDISEDMKEYLEECLDHIYDGEERYLVWAHDNIPKGYDYECVPISRGLNFSLEAIFDAFDEICLRMKNEAMLHKTV